MLIVRLLYLLSYPISNCIIPHLFVSGPSGGGDKKHDDDGPGGHGGPPSGPDHGGPGMCLCQICCIHSPFQSFNPDILIHPLSYLN